MNGRMIGAVVSAVLLLGVAGCGIFKSSTSQASSESSSKSSSSPFKSSSASSGDDENAFQQDVRDYTAEYASEGGDVAVFRRDITTIAEHHGVTDWEALSATYVAMGRGLKHAGLPPGRAEAVGLQLTDADRTRLDWVLAGYREPVR